MGWSWRRLLACAVTAAIVAAPLSAATIGDEGPAQAAELTHQYGEGHLLAADPSGGYWTTDAAGAVEAHAGASTLGSVSGFHLNQPIVGMASTPAGAGYWLVASDGGIFSFGDAPFWGSTGAIHLNQPIVGMAPTPDGAGYWLVASDGGIFSFGDAPFEGSLGASTTPALGIVVDPARARYLVVDADGNAVAFGPWAAPPAAPAPPAGPPPTSTSTTTTTTAPSGDVPWVRVDGNTLVDAAGTAVRLVGVDATETEYACVQGGGFSWAPSDPSEAGQIASWGTNTVRVPLNEDCWLGINGAPDAITAAQYRNDLVSWVADLNAAGLVAILDLHWSAPGSIEATQQWPMADADHSVAFWSSVAATFSRTPGVVYDLFNEPFIGGWDPSSADWTCWSAGCQTSYTPAGSGSAVSYATAGMQQLVDAVRASGADQPIMIGGLAWAGDPCGLDDSGGVPATCMWLADEPHDPLGQLVASFHTYDFTDCTNADCWNHDVLPVAARVPVVTGEFGEEDCSSTYIAAYMDWADANGVSYLGWGWTPDSSNATSCTAAPFGTQGGSGNNLDYLAAWSAQPNAYAPEGAAVRSHFLSLHVPPF